MDNAGLDHRDSRPITSAISTPHGTHLGKRIDDWNEKNGYPPASDWPSRVADAYWLGWFDSQDALLKSSKAAKRMQREMDRRQPLWRRILRKLFHDE